MKNAMDHLSSITYILADYPFVLAGIMMFLAFVLAWVVERGVVAFVKRLAAKTKGEFDDRLLEILHKPLFYSVLVFGLSTASSILELPEGLRGCPRTC